MTYKTKSLIYFSCFVISCILYYHTEKQDELQEQLQSKTFVEADFHDDENLDDSIEELAQEQK